MWPFFRHKILSLFIFISPSWKRSTREFALQATHASLTAISQMTWRFHVFPASLIEKIKNLFQGPNLEPANNFHGKGQLKEQQNAKKKHSKWEISRMKCYRQAIIQYNTLIWWLTMKEKKTSFAWIRTPSISDKDASQSNTT